jgi:hypothetical protein
MSTPVSDALLERIRARLRPIVDEYLEQHPELAKVHQPPTVDLGDEERHVADVLGTIFGTLDDERFGLTDLVRDDELDAETDAETVEFTEMDEATVHEIIDRGVDDAGLKRLQDAGYYLSTEYID